jgi:hypothetical protein
MRQNRTKEQMIERLKKQIFHRNDLLEFRNRIFLPTLQKFDGKVYNIRFIKALREANEDELIYVRELEYDHILVEKRFESHNYTDCEQIYIKVIINQEGRIDASASVTDELGKKWVENFSEYTDEILKICSDYDVYMEKAENVRNAIEEYSKVPSAFRENIEFRKTFYL